MQTYLQFFTLDLVWIKTGLRVVHLWGLVLGVGSATLLDLIIARFILLRGISREHVYIVDFSSKIVTIGLGLLWISGIGFLIHYGVYEPAKLENPKIWAKIAIVAVLSINGLLVHYFVLPRIRNQVGKRLLDGLSSFDCSLILLAGTVSVISWYVPLILGALPQLNFVVAAEVILSGYALLLIAVNVIIQVAIVFFLREYSTSATSGRNVLSNRSKSNLLRGSLALAFCSICFSLFMTKAADHGVVLAGPATSSVAEVSKVASVSVPSAFSSVSVPSAFSEADVKSAAPQGRDDAGNSRLESERLDLEAPRDTATTAASRIEGDERAIVVRSINSAEQVLVRGGANSFASAPKETTRVQPPQLKSGFVGSWAADARACEFRPGTGSDLRTIIGEQGARAGASSCAFKQKKQIASAEWEMKAICADESERWESTVRLSLSKNKLKWSGQRGTQIYVKCT